MGSLAKKKNMGDVSETYGNFKKADINDFVSGISDLKVAYETYFGHFTIEFDGKRRDKWKEISKAILIPYAPKHS